MLVVIAFESMFGNTREVAEAVAAGLRAGPKTLQVEWRCASRITADLVGRADLLVVGGPTHYHGLATRGSLGEGRRFQRRAVLTGHLRPRGIEAWSEFGTAHPELPVVRDVVLPGSPIQGPEGDVDLRAWLHDLPDAAPGALAAAFDTRITSRWAGGAAHAIARRLRRHGYRLAVPAEGFLVDGLLGPLRDGEPERARRWGDTLRRRLPR